VGKEQKYPILYLDIMCYRGNISSPKTKRRISLFIFYFLFSIYFYFYFYFCQPPPVCFCYPPIANLLRSRVGFYHLVAGLLNPEALLMKAKFSNLPVPIGQESLILLPYMTDRSIITDVQHGLNSWAPANCDRSINHCASWVFHEMETWELILILLEARFRDFNGCVVSLPELVEDFNGGVSSSLSV